MDHILSSRVSHERWTNIAALNTWIFIIGNIPTPDIYILLLVLGHTFKALIKNKCILFTSKTSEQHLAKVWSQGKLGNVESLVLSTFEQLGYLTIRKHDSEYINNFLIRWIGLVFTNASHNPESSCLTDAWICLHHCLNQHAVFSKIIADPESKCQKTVWDEEGWGESADTAGNGVLTDWY